MQDAMCMETQATHSATILLIMLKEGRKQVSQLAMAKFYHTLNPETFVTWKNSSITHRACAQATGEGIRKRKPADLSPHSSACMWVGLFQ